MPLEVFAGNSAHFDGKYLSSVANVLTNGPKVSTLTKAIVFQFYLPHIHGKIR